MSDILEPMRHITDYNYILDFFFLKDKFLILVEAINTLQLSFYVTQASVFK